MTSKRNQKEKSKRRMRRSKKRAQRRARTNSNVNGTQLPRAYHIAVKAAIDGRLDDARTRYCESRNATEDASLRAIIDNDLAAIAAVEGRLQEARDGFARALQTDPGLAVASTNSNLLSTLDNLDTQPASEHVAHRGPQSTARSDESTRIAIVSFLFNWPSTAGGIVHTVELATFLERAGYQVAHFYIENEPWGVGKVDRSVPFPSRPIRVDDTAWNGPGIQSAVRSAVDNFGPDYVILTDTWNMKPLLAEAVSDYPYFLRQQALECLCPLNNLRLLADGAHGIRQCSLDQLSSASECQKCVTARGNHSGSLHQLERQLCGWGSEAYQQKLLDAVAGAEAVLTLNPEVAELYRPYACRVHVVTWGMDPARFPWPWPASCCSDLPRRPGIKRIIMSGLIEEPIKGFHLLGEACERLWTKRKDFELVITGSPAGPAGPFTHRIGWQDQATLPVELQAADLLVMPTIAQEGLSRSTVEAMAVGLPVVASRIGGLPYTVEHGVTGLLFEPGDAADLAEKIEQLLDDRELRRRMGTSGRKRFESDFTWPAVIERNYRPLLTKAAATAANSS